MRKTLSFVITEVNNRCNAIIVPDIIDRQAIIAEELSYELGCGVWLGISQASVTQYPAVMR